MTKIISFISQKGGVGKTTSTINFAMALALAGYKILLIDADPQGSLRFSANVEQSQYGSFELFTKPEVNLLEICQATQHENLSFILSNINTLEDTKIVENLVQDFSILQKRLDPVKKQGQFDFIVIDPPATMSNLTLNVMYATDYILFPLQCEVLAVKSLKHFLQFFKELREMMAPKSIKIAGIFLTMYDKQLPLHQKIATQVMQSLPEVFFHHIIPRDKAISESVAFGKSVLSYNLASPGAVAYMRLMKEFIHKFNLN